MRKPVRRTKAGEKAQHASTQKRYHLKKMLTHKKICIWVPKVAAEDFWRSYERMKRRWSK